MKLLLVVFSIILLGACRSGRITGRDSSVNDSTAVKEKIVTITKDSIVKLPADSSWLKMLLDCDSTGEVLIKQIEGYKAGKQVQIPKATIEDNRLFIVCDVDSFEVYQRFASLYRDASRDSIRTVTVKVVDQVPVHFKTGLEKFMIKSGWAFWILLLLFGAYKIIQLKSKTIKSGISKIS